MPELAELKLTADYINQQSVGRTFLKVKKNPKHKGVDIFECIDFPFQLAAKSRGKELMIEISTAPEFATAENYKVYHLMMTMGMSGYFNWVPAGTISKHSHLKFYTGEGSLDFIDVRRFGKWKWGYWNKDRGPDPTEQFQDFVRNIKDNLNKKEFDKPIHEVLMNQKYFNGIGNYIRCEVLYRIETLNPFISARDAIKEYGEEIFMLCKAIPERAYLLGGGELKDWKNPFQFETLEEVKMGWKEFMKCYGVPGMATIIDKGGRRFWYDPKWKSIN
jgi:endonuclease VIII-like 1